MDMIRYEEMAVKAVFAVVVAVIVVLCGLMVIGVEIVSCNIGILLGGISMVAVIIWLMLVLKL